MSVEELKEIVIRMPSGERAEFAAWLEAYQEHESDAWDRQIEADAKAGKLDWLAKEAIAEHEAGRTRPL